MSNNYASAYVGGGYALGKAGLYEKGWRVRAVGAYGRYHYNGSLLVDGAYLPTIFEGQNNCRRQPLCRVAIPQRPAPRNLPCVAYST